MGVECFTYFAKNVFQLLFVRLVLLSVQTFVFICCLKNNIIASTTINYGGDHCLSLHRSGKPGCQYKRIVYIAFVITRLALIFLVSPMDYFILDCSPRSLAISITE